MSNDALLPIELAAALASVRRGVSGSNLAGAITRVRDLILFRQGPLVLVTACDSNAGIGSLPHDVIRQPLRNTGFGAAKVPLMEILAAGATPILLINNLGLPVIGRGREVLDGIELCTRMAGTDIVITGSDETNVATTQTSVGITVIGACNQDDLRLGTSIDGDAVVAVGRPMDGITVAYDEFDEGVVTPADVRALLACDSVHEVLPVGSRGIGYEANHLAATANLRFSDVASSLDTDRSAGSSTCVLVTCAVEALGELSRATRHECTVVGRLTATLGWS